MHAPSRTKKGQRSVLACPYKQSSALLGQFPYQLFIHPSRGTLWSFRQSEPNKHRPRMYILQGSLGSCSRFAISSSSNAWPRASRLIFILPRFVAAVCTGTQRVTAAAQVVPLLLEMTVVHSVCACSCAHGTVDIKFFFIFVLLTYMKPPIRRNHW